MILAALMIASWPYVKFWFASLMSDDVLEEG